jgi:hypothetical protein
MSNVPKGRGLRFRSSRRRRLIQGGLGVALLAGTAVAAVVPLAPAASASPGWTAPAPVDDTTPTAFSSVSCPTSNFCMASDFQGRELTYNGHVWSAPVPILSSDLVSSVSCASANFCAAVDDNGQAFIYNGHHWSAPDVLDSGSVMPSVSCAPGTSFCVTVSGDDGPYGFIYSGGTWSAAVLIDTAPTTGIDAVSCPSATFCMAVDVSGNVVTTTDGGSTWSAPVDIDGSNSSASISCATASFCTVVDLAGNAITYTGSWAAPKHIGGPAMTSVSCVSSGVCVAGDSSSDGFFTTNFGSSWTTDVGIGPDEGGVKLYVACQTATFCPVVDSIGQSFAYNNGGWTAPTLVDGLGTNLSSVSCVSSIFCAAVDSNGNALTYNGSAWSAPIEVDGSPLTAVSCATASLCVAVDNNDDETTFNGTSWSGLSFIDGNEFALNSVSCTASPTILCVAVDGAGSVMTSDDGASWSSTSPIDSGNSLNSVSCSTASFCIAVDGEGQAFTFDGTSWSGPQSVDPGQELVSVSCTTTPSIFCAAVDNEGNGFSYSGSWSATFVDMHTPTSVSCVTATYCQVADQAGQVEAFDESTLVNVDPGNSLTAISCPSTTFCAAVDDNGNAALFNGVSNGVAVSQVSPNTGPTTGGTSITITGTGFTAGSEVDLAGVAATGVAFVSSTEITATAPAASAGTVDVIVTSAGGSSTANPADQFTYTVVQSPSNANCDPSCTETVATPLNQTQVSVTGSSGSPTANVSLVVNTDTLTCSGTYNYPTPVSTLSPTGFEPGASVVATVKVGQEPSKKGIKVCYGASSEATSGTFLPFCPKHKPPHPPCIESLAEQGGGIVATLLVPATDPRFWAGGGALDVTKFSPTHGAPGKKVTIKGKNLSQVVAVVVGGAQAKILSRSSSKVVVVVPQGATTGVISMTANSGVETSALPFTVT